MRRTMPVAFFDVVVGAANTAHLQRATLRYGASHQLPANLPHPSQGQRRHHNAAEKERDGPERDEREERIVSNEASCSFGAHGANLDRPSLQCSVHPRRRSLRLVLQIVLLRCRHPFALATLATDGDVTGIWPM